MSRFEELYEHGVTAENLSGIKVELTDEKKTLPWEDYYWGGKSLYMYDADETDPETLLKILNKSTQYGLKMSLDQDKYLDVMRMTASLYMHLEKYDPVSNRLSFILDSVDPAPDWVYHDLVFAEMHTDEMKRMLRKPNRFLEDLAHSDETSGKITEKQINIFKAFLTEAKKYIDNHPNDSVDKDTLGKAADFYAVKDSSEWKIFSGESVQAGETDENKDTNREQEQSEEQKRILEEKNKENEVLSDKLAKAEGDVKAVHTQMEALQKEKDKIQDDLEKALDKIQNFGKKEAEYKSQIEELSNQSKPTSKFIYITNKDKIEKLQKELKENEDGKKKAEQTAENAKQALQIAGSRLAEKIKEGEEKDKEIEALKSKMAKTGQPVSKIEKAEGIICRLLWFDVTRKTTELLNKYLPVDENWWNRKVYPFLSDDQKMRANTNDLDQLNQLDLYVLLKILQKNWNDLREKNMSTFFRMNWDLVSDLLDVRNRFAHFTEESYSNIQAKNDIFTIADYLAAVGESQDKVKAIKLEGISLLRM